MSRLTTFEVPIDTAMCSAQQLHPWTLLGIGMNGWARWLREHLVPFRVLVGKYGVGVVILGFDLEYFEPCTFFDADVLGVTFGARVREDGGLLSLYEDFEAGGIGVGRLSVVGRVVRISSGGSLAARPGELPNELLARFDPEDRFSGSVPRVLEPSIRDTEWSPEVSTTLRVHRGHCEAADQWSFTELPRILADARESWALGVRDEPRAKAGLGAPVRRLIAELTRPLFIFDVATQTLQTDGSGLRYLHRIHGASHVHATVYEELRELPGVA